MQDEWHACDIEVLYIQSKIKIVQEIVGNVQLLTTFKLSNVSIFLSLLLL